jgi:hypothetical protein
MGKYNEIKNLISQHVGNIPKNAFVVTYFREKQGKFNFIAVFANNLV